MKKMIIVYNPRSSHFRYVDDEVLSRAKGLRGWMVGKYEVEATNVDDNARKLARIITDDTLVVSAGGDATANIAVNGAMLTKATGVRVGILGYGNFNDAARCFGKLNFDEVLHGKAEEVWPLECKINGLHWRYGVCYFSIGMFAEACAVFDHPKTRRKLQKGRKNLIFSLAVLARWWFKQRKKRFMPKFLLGDAAGNYEKCDVSDYMAVNSRTVARVMRGGKWHQSATTFWSMQGQMNRISRLFPMMLRSVFHRIPGKESNYDSLIFDTRGRKMMIQAEGEYRMFENVKKIEFCKAKKPVMIVSKYERSR